MRARPQIREILIEKKMLRWCRIARMPDIDPRCRPWRARKNYWKLCAKYPEIMRRLGLKPASVYE
jgi:hypothetical protein